MRRLRIHILLLLGVIFTGFYARAANPAAAQRSIPAALRKSIDSLINEGLNAKAYPGVQFLMGDRQGPLYSKTYGYHDYSKTQPVTSADVYDLASLTKVLSTTFVMMHLYDRSLYTLRQTVGDLLPELRESSLAEITVQELLTHTSGLRPQVFYPYLVKAAGGNTRLFNRTSSEAYPHFIERNLYMTRDIRYDSLYVSQEPREGYRRLCDDFYVNPAFDTLIVGRMCADFDPERKGRYSYTDSNFYLLQLIAERLTDKPLDVLTQELYDRIGCANIGFSPAEWKSPEEIVPTEDEVLMRRRLIHGYVHDELAAVSGGVCGNAGLFGNAAAVGQFCELMLNNGKYGDQQIISPETVRLFTASPLKSQNIYRGLGFDKRSAASNELGGDARFGHTGFTGTFFWVDRTKGIYMVFLANRVNPTRSNNKLSTLQTRVKIWAAMLPYF